ncbi:MAG TPA: tetratricopeptide repeat protein [Rubricoccaceae bacterium]|nr:tetratricopeptide repeat protein [Rubricoccaceae bacterium]
MPVRSARRVFFLSISFLVFFGVLPARAQLVLPQSGADPARAEAIYEEARALYDAGLYAPAARAFADFREAYPTHPRAGDALFYEAQAALAAGDDAGAAERFLRFREAYPAHPLATRARLSLAEHYYAQGAYDEAATALEEVLRDELPPDDEAGARYLLGQTRLRLADYDAALASFERAASIEASPVAPRALYAVGALQLGMGEDAAAADAFERLGARYPDAPENTAVGLGLADAYARLGRYEEVVTETERRMETLTGPERDRAAFLRGDALLRLGRADEARRALTAVPDTSGLSRPATFARARLAFDAGDYEDAAALFAAVRTAETASGDDTDDDLAHEATYYEGLALKRMGTLGEAERRLAAATLRRPDGRYADAALLELGLLRFERRLHEQAAQSFEALLRDYPDSPHAGEAARMAGESYAALGDTRRAREAYRRAERLGAGSPELRTEVEFQDAYALFREGDYAEATDRLLAVAEDDPRGPRAGEALFWAGESAFQARDYARAERILSTFLASHPDHRQADAARYVLGWTHFKRRDYASAARAFERFLSAYTPGTESVPYYADAHLRLADSYYALGRFDEAEAVYARAREAAPAEQGADYALFQSGQAAAAAGRPDDALAAWDRLLAEFPSSSLRAEATYAKGDLHLQRGAYAEAIPLFEEVMTRYPRSPLAAKAALAIADAHYNAEDYDEAEERYRVVLTDYTDSPFVANALEGLEFTLQAQGRGAEFEEVARDFEQRVDDPAARTRLRLRQAQLAFDREDFAAALDAADGIERDLDDPELAAEALLVQARALRGLGRPGEAGARLQRLLTRYPDTAAADDARADLDGGAPPDEDTEDRDGEE